MKSTVGVSAKLRRFLRDRRGGTAIEYGLIAGCISVAVAGVALSVGSTLTDNYYGKVAAAFDTALGNGGGGGGGDEGN